jgi:hypothetical protein
MVRISCPIILSEGDSEMINKRLKMTSEVKTMNGVGSLDLRAALPRHVNITVKRNVRRPVICKGETILDSFTYQKTSIKGLSRMSHKIH